MSSVCCLQFHHTSPSIPVKCSQRSSIHQRHCPAPLQPTLAIHLFSESGVSAYAVCICQSRNGNLHFGGHTLAFWFSDLRWRGFNTNQRSDLYWSFIKRHHLWGSTCALLVSSLGYQKKISSERLRQEKGRSGALFILVWRCLRKIVLGADKFVFPLKFVC